MTSPQRGFSLLELLLALTLLTGLAAIVFSAIAPSESAFAVQTERADLQQRLRVVVEALARDLASAGAGPSTGLHQGPLTRAVAAVLPYRLGALPLISDEVLTVVTVPPTHAQTTIAAALGAQSGVVGVQLDPGCPLASLACGFTAGMMVGAFDGTGALDVFVVRNVAGASITLDHMGPVAAHVYPPGSALVELQIRTFSRRNDPAGTGQLVRESGPLSAAVPVADHLVGLAFQYFGDPQPPRPRVGAPAGELRTTYGPAPPPPGTQTTSYPPGENCVITIAGGPSPRLPILAPDTGPLVRLTDTELSDGPWCPDAFHPLRFDADLLRVRRISVWVRVEAASPLVRGPAGPLFTRGGTARDASRYLPDLEAQLNVSPANLSLTLPP